MSDRELVTFNAEQFSSLTQWLSGIRGEMQIIRERLGPVDKNKSIQQTLEQGFASLSGVGGGNNSDVLTAINNLSRKVDEFMSTQEERLRGVKTKLDAIQSGVDKIQQQLADLKANNPELEDEISAIEATANAIDTDVNPVVTEPDTGTGGTTGDGGVVTGDEGGATPSGRR